MLDDQKADPNTHLADLSPELRHELRDVYPIEPANAKGKRGRKRKQSREDAFGPRMFFFGTPRPVPDKDELLEALRVTREHFVEAGYDLPTRLRAELLSLLRAHRRRLDSMTIAGKVDEYAREGLPVAREASGVGETAFEAAARYFAEMGWFQYTASNVERIYRKTIAASRNRRRMLPGPGNASPN